MTRASLKFGLSFSPEEAQEQRLHIALVPQIALQRWEEINRADSISDAEHATSPSGKYIERTGSDQLTIFVKDLELETLELSNSTLVGRTSDIFHSTSPSLSEIFSALRIIGSLQPAPSKGLTIKVPLIKKALSSIQRITAKDILTLRNFDWEPYDPKPMPREVYIEAFKSAFKSQCDIEFKREALISISDRAKATTEWRAGGEEALKSLTNQDAMGLADAVISTLFYSPSNGALILQAAHTEPLDEAMAEAASFED